MTKTVVAARPIQVVIVGASPIAALIYEIVIEASTEFHHSNVRLPLPTPNAQNPVYLSKVPRLPRSMTPRSALLLLFLPLSLSAADLVFAEKSEWETVSEGHQFAEGMAWDRDGHFYFTDVPRSQLFKVDRESGKKSLVDGATGRANGIAFGPDGRLYGCANADRCIYVWETKSWQKTAVAEGTQSNDLVVLHDGTIFYTEPAAMTVWRLAPGTFAR